MNVLVTGSNGFIGSYVCRYLKEKNEYVIGLGRRSEPVTAVDAYISCDMDSEELSSVADRYELSHLNVIIHLAADMRKEPHNIEVVAHNCTGSQRLLEFCERQGIPTFLQLSSLPVIGEPKYLPITEDHPLEPPTVYHATKIMEELLADYAMRKHGIRAASFRISAPVGIRMNERTIFSTFVRNALRNEPLVIAGKGGRKQTYIHARDIAEALYHSLKAEEVKGVYNLSSYNLISNLELAKLIISELNSSSEILFTKTEDPEETRCWEVSIEKLKKDSGFEPKIDLKEAIHEYADWVKENGV